LVSKGACTSLGGATCRDRRPWQAFSLGVNRRRRRLLAALIWSLLVSTTVAAHPAVPSAQAAPPVFGLDYWPQCSSNNALGNSDGVPGSDWDKQKPIVRRDLDHIASLGAGVVRFVIVPNGVRCNGTPWDAWELPGEGQGGRLTSEFTDQTGINPVDGRLVQPSNFAELIGMAKYRKLKVIVSFANTHLKIEKAGDVWPPPPETPRGPRKRWEWAYGQSGWNRPGTNDTNDGFLQDALKWVKGYVDPVEGNPAKGIDPCSCRSAVIAYDYFNEASEIKDSSDITRSWPYLNYLYANTDPQRGEGGVPVGKRLVSVLRADPVRYKPENGVNDGQLLKNNLMGTLDFVDFHSYRPTGVNPYPPETSYDFLKGQLFPDATVLMGEFGGDSGPPPGDETAHKTAVLDYMVAARTSRPPIAPDGFPYYMNWMLWDRTPPLAEKARGLGFEPHMPKDALGTVAAELNTARPQSPATQLVPNPDMEDFSGNPPRPDHWSAGPLGTAELRYPGSTPNAATNTRYARVELPSERSAPLIWVVSDPIPVPDLGTAGRRLMVNGYVRASPTNMQAIGLAVAQYDDQGNETVIPREKAPVFNPPGWLWRNYLHAMPGDQSWSVDLDPDTTRIKVVFSGAPTLAPSYLDVDTVSAAVVPVP
jgi:hypothetical protein